MLEVYGINVLIERKEVKEEENAKDGVVLSQDVEAGTKLRANDTITLFIPDIVVKYPDFTDGSYTVEQVQAFCDEHNVTLKINYEPSSSYNPGSIIYQSRQKGFTVTEGTVLTIRVAKANDGTTSSTEAEDICDGTDLC
jgi:beta-lactam-binding protein with PASTA domain